MFPQAGQDGPESPEANPLEYPVRPFLYFAIKSKPVADDKEVGLEKSAEDTSVTGMESFLSQPARAGHTSFAF